ncbi:MAG: hypothetical protein ACOCVC_00170 [Spirochaeta sp.]
MLNISVFWGMILLLAAAGVPSLAAESAGESSDSGAAEIYIDHAYDLLQEGLLLDARQLAERALRYNESSADAHAVVALSYRPQSADTETILHHLRQALHGGRLVRFSETELRVTLSTILRRVGRLDESAEVLPEIDHVGIPKQGVLESWVELHYARGDYRDGDRLLEEGLRLYPRSAVLADILLQRDPVPDFYTRSFVEHALQNSPRYLQSLLRLAEMQTDMQDRETLYQRYFALGGSSARAAWLRLADALDQDMSQEAVQNRFRDFRDNGGLQRWDLLYNLYAGDLPETIARQLSEELDSYTGTIYWYEPYSSMPSQWMELRDGTLVEWSWDQNLNGRADREVGFVDGMPHQAVIRRSSIEQRYTYHFYPWVIGYEERRNDGSTHYTIVPFSMEIPLFDQLPVRSSESWASQRISDPEIDFAISPSNDTSRIRIQKSRLQDGIQLKRLYRDGMLAREEYRENGDNLFRIIEFRGGVPYRSSESLARDGYFDMSGMYIDGELAARAFDTNRDGTADVWDYLNQPEAQVWRLGSEPLIGAVLDPRFPHPPNIDILYLDDEQYPNLRVD